MDDRRRPPSQGRYIPSILSGRMRSRASKASATDEKEAATEPTSPRASADSSKKSQKKVKQVFHYYFTRKSRRKSAGSPSQCSVVSGISAVSAITPTATVPPIVTLEGYSKDLVIRNPSRKTSVRAAASPAAARPEAGSESLDFDKGLGDLVTSSCEESAAELTKGSSECKARTTVQHSRSRKQSTERDTAGKCFPDSRRAPVPRKASSVIAEEDAALMQVSEMVACAPLTKADRGGEQEKCEPDKHPYQVSSDASSSNSSCNSSNSSSSTVHSGDNRPGHAAVCGEDALSGREVLQAPIVERHRAVGEATDVTSHHFNSIQRKKNETTCNTPAANTTDTATLALTPMQLQSHVPVMPPTPVEDLNRTTQAWESFWTPQTPAHFPQHPASMWQTTLDHSDRTRHAIGSPSADTTSNAAVELTSRARKNLLTAFDGYEPSQAKPTAVQLERVSGTANEAHLSPTATRHFPSHDPFMSSTPAEVFRKPFAAKEVPWANFTDNAATRAPTDGTVIFSKLNHNESFIESAREGMLSLSPHSVSGRRQPDSLIPQCSSARPNKGGDALRTEPIKSCVTTDLTSIKDNAGVLSASPFGEKEIRQQDGAREEPSTAVQKSTEDNASAREKPSTVVRKFSDENVPAKEGPSASVRESAEGSTARVNSPTHGEGNGETLAGEVRPALAHDANAGLRAQGTASKDLQPPATECADELHAKSQNAQCFPCFPEKLQREQADQIKRRISDAESKLRSKVTSVLRPSLLPDTCSTALPIETLHGRSSGFARLRKRLDDGRPPSAQARQHVTMTKWKPKAYEEFRQPSEKRDKTPILTCVLESSQETGNVPEKRDSSTQAGGNFNEAGPSVSTQTLHESPPSLIQDAIRGLQQAESYRKDKTSLPRRSRKMVIPPWMILTCTAFLMAIAHYFGVKVGHGKLCN